MGNSTAHPELSAAAVQCRDIICCVIQLVSVRECSMAVEGLLTSPTVCVHKSDNAVNPRHYLPQQSSNDFKKRPLLWFCPDPIQAQGLEPDCV